jgi:metacaspase-1
LIPFDCDPAKLPETALRSDELTDLLQSIRAQKLVVMLDACHSAGAGEVKNLRLVTETKTRDGYQLKAGLSGMPNSLFTYFLLAALKGAASTHGDGTVRVFDVFHYVSAMVPSKAASQHPIFESHDLENSFSLALVSRRQARI